MMRTAFWRSAFLIAAPAALALASLALAPRVGAQQSGGEGRRIPPIDIAATFTAEAREDIAQRLRLFLAPGRQRRSERLFISRLECCH